MGNSCMRNQVSQQNSANRKIDKWLENEKEDRLSHQKLLLLGTGESGKSTIRKQFTRIHGEGFTEEERIISKMFVNSLMLRGMYTLLLETKQYGSELSKDTEDIVKIMSIVEKKMDLEPITVDVLESIRVLWEYPIVQKTWEMRSNFQIDDCLQYFFENIKRIAKDTYLPSDQDMLRLRVPTAGCVEISLSVNDVNLRIVDVGGQRSERRKWIHVFDNVNAIIFVVAINEYDQTIREDSKTNRLDESLYLYSTVVNNTFFLATPVIIFLNKIDLFDEKLKKVPLTVFFKDYTGPMSHEACVEEIATSFRRSMQNKQKAYIHETCATDTNQIQKVLDSAINIVVEANLRLTGME